MQFETLLRRVTSSLEPVDIKRAIIFSEHLDRPISTQLMLVSEMRVEKIMACATKILQSKSEVHLDEGFNIEMITIRARARRPVGSGKRNRSMLIPSIDRLSKTSIRCVPDDDLNICCAKAIILAIAEVEKDADLRILRKKDCSLLQRRALALHQKTGVPQGPCGFEEIALFEQYLKIVTGVNPFTYVTIASDCMAVYRLDHIKPKMIAMIPVQGYCNFTNFSRDSIRWLDFDAQTEGHRILHSLNGTGGAKNYAYKLLDGSEVCKIRGFTLNFQNSLVLTYESVNELVSSMDATRFNTITYPR
ncbi:UNVERIFIED_CONTAM: hypothetical protein NCL1_39395 [Trichonephila clavipes]